MYIKNQDSKYAPVNPALCGFAKVSLGAGEEKELTITVSKEAYKVVNDEGEKILILLPVFSLSEQTVRIREAKL